MNWSTLELVLNFSNSCIAFAVNWFLQSTLLISAGLLAAWLFRNRGSAFQSAVYRTTLLAVLVGPLVSLAMSYSGLDGWSLKLPKAFAVELSDVSDNVSDIKTSAEPTNGPIAGAAVESSPFYAQKFEDARVNTPGSAEVGAVKPTQASAPIATAGTSSTVNTMQLPQVAESSPFPNSRNAPTPASKRLLTVHQFGWLAIGLSFFWIAVFTVRMLRMATVISEMHRLRTASIPASRDEVEICQRIAEKLNIALPLVLRSPFLTSPFLHGIRRPAVLLPADLALPLQDVFVHELAHLQRRDCFWLLLRRVATNVFFFQPLLFWLGRRIEVTAEEVCDDFVVQFGGNRESYASSLVDIAAQSVRPMAIAGVGIVSLRSLLAQRVCRIMDTSRSLSTRVGNFLLVLVYCCGLIGSLIVGFVGLSSNSEAIPTAPLQAITPSNSDEGEQGNDESADAAETQSEVTTSDKKSKVLPEKITGRVFAHDGKAVVGAKLLWFRTRVYDIDPMQPKLLAETDKDGEFSFTSPAIPDPQTEPASWDFHERIAIVAPGHGFKIVAPHELKPQKSESVFGAIAAAIVNGTGVRLPAEGKPLRGRIVTIEGTPVVGATLRIRYYTDKDGTNFYQSDPETKGNADAKWRSRVFSLLNVIEPVPQRFALPSTTTNANGEFELTSLPNDCLLQLLLEGEGIQSTDIIAQNVDGEKLIVDSGSQSLESPKTIYRNNFLFVAGPSRPVVGRVTDLDTGEPVSNAVVRAFTVHGEAVSSTRERQHFATRTDKDGRYRISGLPLGNANRLAAFTTDDVAYMPVGHEVDTSKNDSPTELNFTLKRCVWAKGKVKDGETGKPFAGELSYYWFRDRILEEAIPGLRGYNTDGLYFTNINGEFRIPVLATRGVLAYRWEGNGFEQPSPIDRFPRGLGAEKIQGKDERMNAFPTMPHYLMAGNYNFVTEISPGSSDQNVEVEMLLLASKPVHLKLAASNDEALPTGGYQVYGLNERWGWQDSSTTEPTVMDLLPNQTRKVLVFHRETGLAGGVTVDEHTAQPVQIKLTKSGRVKGRLVDKNGDVITDGVVIVDYAKLWGDEPYAIWVNHPKLIANPAKIPVDSEGRFELEGLIPGWKYSANVDAPRKLQGQMMSIIIGSAFVDLVIEAGETRDLGDLTVGYPNEKPTEDTKTEAPTISANTPTAPIKKAVHTGLVVDSEDRPLADARVHIAGWSMNTQTPQNEIIAETTTKTDGTFSIELNGASSTTHGQPVLFVRKDGFGIALKRVDLDASSKIETAKLLKEGIITARLVDIEGQPLVGLEIQPTDIVASTHGPYFENYAPVASDKTLATTTDDQGRFSIRGVAIGQGVHLQIKGNDRIAPQSIALNTGMPEQRGERDGTYRHLVRNLKPDEDAVITLAPAQIFEGTIRYADTKEPVPDTKVSIWSSQQENDNSMISMEGKTNANGRYHISANPGVSFGIQAFAPEGVPYLNRKTPSEESIKWRAGDRVREFDYELPRGVLLRGTITERDSNTAVADAYIQYVPESANNKNDSEDILTGWQAIQRSDQSGKFEFAVLPGPGRLLIFTPGEKHILKPIGSRTIYANKEGGSRNYVHAFERIDPQPNSEPLELEITVERGKRISGQVVNTNGDTPKEVYVVSTLNISPYSLYWRAHKEPVLNGRFEFGALADGVEYKTHFLDAENKLGATAILTADNDNSTIKLEPCGTASARFVDEEGHPIRNNAFLNLHLVLTPGANQYNNKAMRSGQLAEDSDYVSNIDHRNHPIDLAPDADGRITYSALIPGATYELRVGSFENPTIKSFVLKSGEAVDLGEFTLKPDE